MRRTLLCCCCSVAAAQHLYFDHAIAAGPLGLDMDGQLAVVGFGKRGAYHPLAVAGVKSGDVITHVDGEAQPRGGLEKKLTLPRRYREAQARLAEDWPRKRRIRFRRDVEVTAAPAAVEPEDGNAGPTASAEAAAGPTQAATTVSSGTGGGRVEVAIGGDRKSRGGRTVAAEAALAAFGAASSCTERPAFLVDGDGCDPRDLRGARGRVVLVRRGGCGFAEKAYVAAAQGAAGVVVLETDAGRRGAEAPAEEDKAFLGRHPAARDVAIAVVGFEGAQQIRVALREHAAKRGVTARFVFGSCDEGTPKARDVGSVDATEAEAAALVRAAFRPGSSHAFDFASHTVRGALWTLQGGPTETLGVVATGPWGLPARVETLPASMVFADVRKCAAVTERGAVVALAVRNCSSAGCPVSEIVPTLDAPAAVLLLPDGGADAPPPRCDVGGAVPVAAAPAGGLLAALRRGAAVTIAAATPAPRLERTWRELAALRDPRDWPDDARQRRRVLGSMRKVCDDAATRAHLEASWGLVSEGGGRRDEL